MDADITQLLQAHGGGRADALGQLVPLVYDDLRRVARAQLRRHRPSESLNTTGLVHEAYLRLVDQSRASYRDRGHFFAVCAVAMRQIIVDYARRRGRRKRGGDQVLVALDDPADPVAQEAEQLLDIDAALQKLARMDERLARIVECRFFAGFNETETAEALGISVRTAQREWFKARAWLRAELGAGTP
ncbi:MAG TPA: ECF-type sigma factor [Vicinamibacterales bacterium]|nr:ECF-type sigma factor [Vicinamibacterales bacterium]